MILFAYLSEKESKLENGILNSVEVLLKFFEAFCQPWLDVMRVWDAVLFKTIRPIFATHNMFGLAYYITKSIVTRRSFSQ